MKISSESSLNPLLDARTGQLVRRSQQQEKILDVVSALVAQHANGKRRVA